MFVIIIIIILLGIIIFLGFKLKTKIVIDKDTISEYNTTIRELKIYQNNLQKDINADKQLVEQLNTQIKSLQTEYETRNINLDQHFKQLSRIKQVSLEQDFQRRKQDKQLALDVIGKAYEKEIEDIQKKRQDLTEQYNNEVKEIQNNINIEQERFNALLQPLQQYEKEQQDKLFYTVQIPEEYRADIQYLLVNIAPQLKHPDIINKLIWSEYVRPYLDAACKRIGINNEPGIYKITNINDNKSYIGKSTDIKKRIAQHFKAAIGISTIAWQAVHDAMLAQGLWNWSIEPIIYCDKDKLSEMEKFYIDFFKTQEYGYNKKMGG